MRRLFVILVSLVILLIGAPAFAGGSHGETQDISAKALDDHECDSSEWHFVITQVKDESKAPASISVTFSGGDTVSVPLDKFTGGVAHYTEVSHLDETVVSATASIYAKWSGQFNLSHGPCGEDPVDVCPNIEGDQETVPDGMIIDESGDCVEEPPPPTEPEYGFTIGADCEAFEVFWDGTNLENLLFVGQSGSFLVEVPMDQASSSGPLPFGEYNFAIILNVGDIEIIDDLEMLDGVYAPAEECKEEPPPTTVPPTTPPTEPPVEPPTDTTQPPAPSTTVAPTPSTTGAPPESAPQGAGVGLVVSALIGGLGLAAAGTGGVTALVRRRRDS